MATDIIARALAANGGGGGEPVDAYTKAETNDLLATKADKNTSYTKTEVNNLLAEKEDNILSFDTWAEYNAVKDTIPADTYFVIIEDEQENPIPSHNSLMNRDANECHPINAITGLQAELDKKTDTTDTDVLKARMDQLVGTVPPGSADEIADARVMVDGKTSQNLGDAIRTQVTSLKETIDANAADLNEFADNVSKYTGDVPTKLTLTTGSYIDSAGGIANYRDSAYSAPIQVTAGDTVILKAAGYLTNISVISKCSPTGESRTPVVRSSGSSVKEYRYKVTENGYIMVSFILSLSHNLYINHNTEDAIASKGYISGTPSDPFNDLNTLPNNGSWLFVGNANVSHLPETASASEFISVISYNGAGGTGISGTTQIAHYKSSNKTFIRMNSGSVKGSGWSDWNELSNTNENILKSSGYISANNPPEKYNDLNKFPNNGFWILAGENYSIANIPEKISGSSSEFVSVISYNGWGDSGISGTTQIAHYKSSNKTFIRMNSGVTSGSGWSAWSVLGINLDNILGSSGYISANNPSEPLNDLNTLPNNGYWLYGGENFNVEHLPVSVSGTTAEYMSVMSYNGVSGEFVSGTTQIVHYKKLNRTFIRMNSGTTKGSGWSDWSELGGSAFNLNNVKTSIWRPFKIESTTKIAFFGDSITYGIASGKDTQTGLDYTSKNYVNYFTQHYGVTSFSNYAISATGFCKCVPETNPTIVNRVKGVTNLNQYDVIFIAGGTNDYGFEVSIEEFTSTLDSFFAWLKDNYAGKVVFITPIERYPDVIKVDYLSTYRNIIGFLCSKYDFNCINGLDISFGIENATFREALIKDGVHPTEAGHKAYAKALSSIIG